MNSEHYPISLNGLFHVIQATAERCQYSLFDYFDRTGTWPLSEEVLIHGNVEPDYLLGHWDGGAWTEWAPPETEESRDRLTLA